MVKNIKKYIWIILFLLFSIISYFIDFNPVILIFSNFWNSFIEMLFFIPFLFILIGLLDVWFPKEIVEKHIGKDSGLLGILYVIILAMLQAGPLYVAFPIAYLLYSKGASIRNIFIYLGAFSSLKIPMIGIEIGYLGLKFTLLRTLISLPIFILIGFIMEYLLKNNYKINKVKK